MNIEIIGIVIGVCLSEPSFFITTQYILSNIRNKLK
jgi:hypothetical protein